MITRVMPKTLQIDSLSSIFIKLNPDADPAEVDWTHEVDETLTLPENRVELSIIHPGYQWFSSEDERGDVKREADENLSEYLSYLVSSVSEEVQPQLIEVFADYRKRYSQGVGKRTGLSALKHQVQDLLSQVKELSKTGDPEPEAEAETEAMAPIPVKQHKRTIKELARKLGVPLYEQVGEKCKMCGSDPLVLYKAEPPAWTDWEWRCIGCDMPYTGPNQTRCVHIHLPDQKPIQVISDPSAKS